MLKFPRPRLFCLSFRHSFQSHSFRTFRTLFLLLLLAAGLFLPFGPAARSAPGLPLPILMYHNVSEKAEMAGKYCVTTTQLAADLDYLQKNGYHTVTMAQVIAYVQEGAPLPERPVLLTFDDSYESVAVLAGPLLEERGMTAVIGVIGAYADEFTQTEDHHLDYSHLSWAALAALAQGETFELQNHSYFRHHIGQGQRGVLRRPGEDAAAYRTDLTADLMALQKKLWELTGDCPTTFIYPFGAFSEETEALLTELGFAASLSCTETVSRLAPGTDCLRRLGRFNRSGLEDSAVFMARVFGSQPV